MQRSIASCLLPLVLLTALAEGAVTPAQDAADPGAAEPSIVEHSGDPAELLVRFTESYDEIAAADQPWLEVWGDGRVVRHLPLYMRGAGTHVGQLDAVQLDDLLRLTADAVIGFDRQAVAARKREIARRRTASAAQAELHWVSDASTIEIELRLERYLSGQAGVEELRPVRRRVRYRSLRGDSELYAEVAPLARLREAYDALDALVRGAER